MESALNRAMDRNNTFLFFPNPTETDLVHVVTKAISNSTPFGEFLNGLFGTSSGESTYCPASNGLFREESETRRCSRETTPAQPGSDVSARIRYITLCPKPHWYNSGPHRDIGVLTYKHNDYAFAIEEGRTRNGAEADHFFVQAFTAEGALFLGSGDAAAAELMRAAIDAIPMWQPVDWARRWMGASYHIYDDPINSVGICNSERGCVFQDLLNEGCTPSPYMSDT